MERKGNSRGEGREKQGRLMCHVARYGAGYNSGLNKPLGPTVMSYRAGQQLLWKAKCQDHQIRTLDRSECPQGHLRVVILQSPRTSTHNCSSAQEFIPQPRLSLEETLKCQSVVDIFCVYLLVFRLCVYFPFFQY